MIFKSKAYRPRHKPGRMNNTEFEYSKHLELLKKEGKILDYSFECTKIKIGDDCWYTPDFRVLQFDPHANNPVYVIEKGESEWKNLEDCKGKEFVKVKVTDSYFIEFHEVKGTTRKRQSKGTVAKPFIEDDAMVKIKAAAELHPYKFILTWKGLNGQWEKREIN